MLWFALSALMGRARSIIGGALSWVLESLTHILTVSLALMSLYALYEHHEAGKWEQQATHCAAGRADDKAKAKAAEGKAKAKAKTITETNNADHHTTVAAIDAGATRYAATHRVRLPDPATITPSADHNPALPTNPTPAPLMGIAIPEGDFKTCNDDAAWRQGAGDLFQSLIAGGLAIPEDK